MFSALYDNVIKIQTDDWVSVVHRQGTKNSHNEIPAITQVWHRNAEAIALQDTPKCSITRRWF